MADSGPSVPLDQVEWRADSEPYDRNGGTVCRWVPYLNAPIVARLLDEWVGPDGWSDSYASGTLAGKEVLWCHLDIGGVVKSDVGVASNTEAQKGIVSDAFKRAACLKWGVGRNVYDLPTLFAKCGTREKNGKRYATETPDTLPDLLRQLKAKGFDAESGKVRDAEDDATTSETSDDAPSDGGTWVTDEQITEIRRLGKAIKDGGGDPGGPWPSVLGTPIIVDGVYAVDRNEAEGLIARLEVELDKIASAPGAEEAEPAPATDPPGAGEPTGYAKWSREELAQECTSRDLPHSGTKDKMVAELRAWDAAFDPDGVEFDTPQF